MWLLSIAFFILSAAPGVVRAQAVGAQRSETPVQNVAFAPANCVRLEIYVKNDCDKCDRAAAELTKFAQKRNGVVVRTFNVDDDPKAAQRVKSIADYFKIENVTYPVIYGCNTFLQGFNERKTVQGTLERMLTVTAYVRAGCPHCAAAKRFLPQLMRRYPAFRLVEHDVVQDSAALDRMEQVVRRYRQSASSLPVIHLCNQLSIGYDTDATTGRRLESILKYWTSPCPAENKTSRIQSQENDLELVNQADFSLAPEARSAFATVKGGSPLWASFPVLTLFFLFRRNG